MSSSNVAKLIEQKVQKHAEESHLEPVKQNAGKKHKDSAIFWQMLCVARFYLAFAQTGYIHPDEFHQSLQVTAYDLLDIEAAKPWEYTSSSPIRSVTFIGFVSIPFWVLRIIAPVFKFAFDQDILTPNVLLTSSRLFMTLLSFICDFCVLKIAQVCYVRPWQCLEIFAGSYVMLVYATRTFSNSLELILFCLLLWRVSLSIIDSTKVIRREHVLEDLYQNVDSMKDKVKLARLKSKLPSYNFTDSFVISMIVTFGFFIRPTFIIFAFVPVAFWLQRGVVTKELDFWYFNMRFFSLLPGAVLGFIACVLADSFYYHSITFSKLIFWDVTAASFTVTPFNFILYNSNPKNLSSHGFHPYLLHILVNIPLLFGAVGLVGLWRVSKYFANLLFKRLTRKPKVYSLASMLLLSFIFPVLALSLIPHQEPRFLLPLLAPLILLNADQLTLYSLDKFVFSKHFLFLMWQTCNVLGVVFYGFLHQGGVTKTMTFIHDYVALQPPTTHYHVYFSHMYAPPTFLLMRKVAVVTETQKGRKYRIPRSITTFDLGSSKSVLEIVDEIQRRSLNNSDVTSLLCISATLSDEINALSNGDMSVKRIHRIPGHVSMEHLPNFYVDPSKLTQSCDKLCNQMKKIFDFSIDIFAFEAIPDTKVHSQDTLPPLTHEEL